MSKFNKKKKGDLPAVNTASLPDIVFMLLFFFMVATVMRDNELKIKNELVAAYTHLRNIRAQELYGVSYSEMMKNYKDVNWPGNRDKLKENINRLRKEYPQKLSEVQ